LHLNTNEYAKAEEEYNEALAIYRELAGVNSAAYNPYVANTLSNLAELLGKTGNDRRAKEECSEALALITPFYSEYPNTYRKLYDKITRNLATLN